jgi:hypothetical protein
MPRTIAGRKTASAIVVLIVAAYVSPVGAAVLCVSSHSRIVRLRDACRPSESALPIAILDEGRTVQVTGANLQVVSGSGRTNTAPNGLGNVIVGYNENNFGALRTGSHNVVVGTDHTYTSFGGVVVGDGNAITDGFAFCAGMANTVSGPWSSVTGGHDNVASGATASVTGGTHNTASGSNTVVAGGWFNTASENLATVSGGRENTASGPIATVSGGWFNTASGEQATVGGGAGVIAPAANDWAAGGLYEPGS